VANQQADTPECAERIDNAPPGGCIEVIRRLVDRQQLRRPPQRHGELGPLALPVAERRPSLAVVLLHAKLPAPSIRIAVRRCEEHLEIGWRIVGRLGAVDHRPRPGDRSLPWCQFPTREPQQGRLAGTVGTHDGRPPFRQAELKVRKQVAQPGKVAE